MSIFENIAFGKPKATEAEVVRAAQIAGIHQFISKLPDQYATMVGERGEMVSGGEKQRIALARVVLANPEIIVLDEPTSFLDTQTEEQIKSALDFLYCPNHRESR